jgi:HD-GYP domain-containing protein (c-di-GMP phosphodiesterase class II)
LGATDEELEKRYYGALLHDIGKVAVSARILMKPSRLTAAEFEVVQRHPGTSGFVVGAVSFLKEVVPEILYHHERIDGAGYPCGLVGDEIPFEARVLAVADTFEALTSDRPYRRGLTQTQALAEVRRSVGSQLDERPVDALTNLVESGHTFEVLPRRTLEAEPPTTQSLAREA